MNAPETMKPATQPISLAHKELLKSDEALWAEEIAYAILGVDKPSKIDIKSVTKQLKQLADLGMIEIEPRAGGVPFYRLIVAVSGDSEGGETDAPAARIPAPEYDPASVAFPADFATDPALQYLAPEDYEMPPADPALLASANRMLCNRLEAVAEAIRASTIPSLEGIAGAEDLAPHVKTLCDALAAAESVATARGHTIDGLRREVDDLRERHDTQIKHWQVFAGRLNTQLATEWRAREAQQEKGNATDVTAAAVGYLVRVPRRPPIIRRKLEAARLAALSAVRAGAARAEVLAVVPVGAARRGAEWREA